MEKENFEEVFNFNDMSLNMFINFQYIEIFQVAFVAVFLLMLSLFFPKQGILTRFISQLTVVYLAFIFYCGAFNIIFPGLTLTLKEYDLSSNIKLPFLGDINVSD